jgi:hypothetical protein
MENKNLFNITFIKILKEKYNFEIKSKDKSILMKIISFILFFNKDFMSSFVTTIGSNIYFPKDYNFEKPAAIVTIAHEVKHILDSRKNKLFNILYLFPQILALFFIPALFLHWAFIFPLAIVLSPAIPAFFRASFEFEAYLISLFVINLFLKYQNFDEKSRKDILMLNVERMNKHFTGSAYYFMFIFSLKNDFEKQISLILSESFEKSNAYALDLKDIFNKSIVT